MSLAVRCPACDKQFKVKAEAAGRNVRCPDCASSFQVQSKTDDDDFLSDLDQAVSSERESPTEYIPRPKKSTKLTRPKPRRKKSVDTKGMISKGASGAGIVALIIVVRFLIAFGQGKFGFNLAESLATWSTFKHPSGFASIDMPGTPTYDAKQSLNGAQAYTLHTNNYQMTLTVVQLPSDPALGNPNGAIEFFNLFRTNMLASLPAARLQSSGHFNFGNVQGLDLTININGAVSLSEFYLFSNTLVGAEYVTKNETKYAAQRAKYFTSIRGPDGNLVRDGASSTSPNPNADAAAPNMASPSPSQFQAKTLAEARKIFQTKLVRKVKESDPVPTPPDSLAQLVHYETPGGRLPAYLTTIPQDGQKHPAIIWVSGGFSNSIDAGFFEDATADNDQTASAFWKAGIVTMYPSLRGGNDNPGYKEAFFGEVDDVLAAYDFLAKQKGIDRNRIYLGGHSTGGTVALLAAESSNQFRAVFSFGPVNDVRGYGSEFIYFDQNNAAELEIRNPARWLNSIECRTFVIEGEKQPGNLQALQLLSKVTHKPAVEFIPVAHTNHFSILAPATKLIAEKILKDQGTTTNITLSAQEITEGKNSVPFTPPTPAPFAKKSPTNKKKIPVDADAESDEMMQANAAPINDAPPKKERKPKKHNVVSLVESELVGGTGGSPFRKSLEGEPMIGVDYRMGQWFGSKALSDIQPVSEGDPVRPGLQRVVAPKGYAIGGVKIFAPQYVSHVQFIFMKVREDGTLDPDLKKVSEWIGGKPNGKPTEFNGEGKRVMGLHGRGAAVIDALGILFEQ